MPDGSAPSITDRLAAVLARNALSDQAHAQIQEVYDLLSKPKRITLMGPPGVGKAGVMALLAGRNLLGGCEKTGTVQLRYGRYETTSVTEERGQQHFFEQLPDSTLFGIKSPVMTEITAPLPALRKISITKLAEADDEAGQVRAMLWAAKQTDLAIWCTRKFGRIEQRLWAQVPDGLRDNAIALMTKCDAYDGDRKAAELALRSKAEHDFAFVMAMQLRDAMNASLRAKVDREEMRRSGGMQLISTILKEIEKGETRAQERAEKLLGDVEVTQADAAVLASEKVLEAVARKASEATVPPVSTVVELPQPGPVEVPKAQPVDRAALVPKRPDAAAFAEAAQIIDPKAQPAKPSSARKVGNRSFLEPDIFPDFELSDAFAEDPAPAPVKLDPLPPEAVTACEGAIIRLQKVGTTFADSDADARDLLDASSKALTALDEDLMDAGRIDHPRFAHLRRMTEDASDLVQLLRLEGDAEASIEAATLLVQMKRSFQSAVAA